MEKVGWEPSSSIYSCASRLVHEKLGKLHIECMFTTLLLVVKFSNIRIISFTLKYFDYYRKPRWKWETRGTHIFNYSHFQGHQWPGLQELGDLHHQTASISFGITINKEQVWGCLLCQAEAFWKGVGNTQLCIITRLSWLALSLV